MIVLHFVRGEDVRSARGEALVTLDWVSWRTGVSKRQLGRIERDGEHGLRAHTFARLKRAFPGIRCRVGTMATEAGGR